MDAHVKRETLAMIKLQTSIQEQMIELEKNKDDLIKLSNKYTKACTFLMNNQTHRAGLQCEVMDDIVQLMDPNIHSDKAQNHHELKENNNNIKETDKLINNYRFQSNQTMIDIQSKQTEFNVGTCNLNKSTSEMLTLLMFDSHKHTAQLEHQKAQSRQAFPHKATSREQNSAKKSIFGSREENENNYLV
jgi:hypothetical protein